MVEHDDGPFLFYFFPPAQPRWGGNGGGGGRKIDHVFFCGFFCSAITS